MRRSTPLAAILALLTLVGCGNRDEATSDGVNQNGPAVIDNAIIEDLPSDGLAAPSDLPLDSESNAADSESNVAGSASGGNAY